jgi:hypothetical protein
MTSTFRSLKVRSGTFECQGPQTNELAFNFLFGGTHIYFGTIGCHGTAGIII